MKVLHGATETLKRTSVIIIETPIDSIVERLGFLTQAGFRIFDLTEPCYYDGSLWQCDAVLLRGDLHAIHFANIHENFDASKYHMFATS
jgi:hypothetical protein